WSRMVAADAFWGFARRPSASAGLSRTLSKTQPAMTVSANANERNERMDLDMTTSQGTSDRGHRRVPVSTRPRLHQYRVAEVECLPASPISYSVLTIPSAL